MSQISEHSEFCNISPPLTAQSAAGGQGCERLAFPAEVCYNGCKKNVRRDVVLIAITNASLPSKKRILTVCVKLFLEQGYKKNDCCTDCTAGIGFQQYFSKYFPCQGRRTG